MKVLVTGHLGYLGVEMVPALRAAGHDVVGLDVGLYDACDFLRAPDPIPTLRVDVRDVTPAHLRGFEAVVHLAGLSNDPLGELDRKLTLDVNHRACVRLAAASKEAGARRFLFASSCSLYGAAAGDVLLDESAPFRPVTAYGESKVFAERELSSLACDSFSPVYLRNATAYGVSRRLRADVVVNNLVGYAFTTGEVLLESDGSSWRPLVHVQDIASAFAACLTAPLEAVHDQAFNVGRTEENYRIGDVATLVAKVVPGCLVAFATGASPDARNYRVDFAKIDSRLPGWRPRWTLREGVEELYRACVEAGLTREQFLGTRYYRVRTVRALQAMGVLDPGLRPRGHAAVGRAAP
jgi:nucleoside-diphosphate-sugar epimerase